MVRKTVMARRGDELREHILFAAKDVFLELGFERASMDVIAARAQTSKRTLYAHFENKENLYLAVVDLCRRLFLNRLKMPADYSGDPQQVLVQFCGRFLEVLLYINLIRMCRVSIAEAERFPEGSAQFFNVIFTDVQERLSDYLQGAYNLSPKASSQAAQELLGRIIHPRFSRALFGLDQLAEELDDSISPDFDLAPVRKAVAEVIETF